jgi:hypothetical protein
MTPSSEPGPLLAKLTDFCAVADSTARLRTTLLCFIQLHRTDRTPHYLADSGSRWDTFPYCMEYVSLPLPPRAPGQEWVRQGFSPSGVSDFKASLTRAGCWLPSPLSAESGSAGQRAGALNHLLASCAQQRIPIDQHPRGEHPPTMAGNSRVVACGDGVGWRVSARYTVLRHRRP